MKKFLITYLIFFSTLVFAEQPKNIGFLIGLTSQQIQNSIPSIQKYDLVILDGENVAVQDLLEIKKTNTKVLAYLSIGTIEKYRSWYRLLKKYRLDFWPEWQEWYANVADLRYQKIIYKRILPKILSKGFDGVFVDNLDMIIKYPRQESAMLNLITKISKNLKENNLLLYAQNGERKILKFAKYLDGWNQEGVNADYSFKQKKYFKTSQKTQKEILIIAEKLKAQGILVFFTSYWDIRDQNFLLLSKDFACKNSSLAFVSNINLNHIPEPINCAVS